MQRQVGNPLRFPTFSLFGKEDQFAREKSKKYAKIARRMLEQISGNWEEWIKFLSTASRVYKYPFLDQLMIYAQRPDAIACADYETWNRQMRRSIRRGASGIALLNDASGHLRLRYAKEIGDDLESLQHEVDGYIQAVYPFREPVASICNEEGKLSGKALNRALWDESGQIYDVVAGTFLIAGLGEENFISLTPGQMW